MHADFVNSQAVATKVEDTGLRRFTHWPTNRVDHALKNLEKFKKAFQRCGLIFLHAGTLTCISIEWKQNGPISTKVLSDVVRISLSAELTPIHIDSVKLLMVGRLNVRLNSVILMFM